MEFGTVILYTNGVTTDINAQRICGYPQDSLCVSAPTHMQRPASARERSRPGNFCSGTGQVSCSQDERARAEQDPPRRRRLLKGSELPKKKARKSKSASKQPPPPPDDATQPTQIDEADEEEEEEEEEEEDQPENLPPPTS